MMNIRELSDSLKAGIKSPKDFKVGVEWEKIGVFRENGQAIPYFGPRGVLAIFKGLMRLYHWKPVYTDGYIIALQKGKASITLEPGGQIELSGQPATCLNENAAELCGHLDEIRTVSEPMNIVWLGIGVQPASALDKIQWVPKKRYRIMRKVLAGKGALTFWMMKKTASIQISIDYLSERDALEKLKLSFQLSPVLTAMFGNSPISDKKLTGRLSERAYIWSKTDARRSGVIHQIFKPGAGFSDYVDYALDVPMMFLMRQNRWIGVSGVTFREFMEKGWRGYKATQKDWELHLTGIFTDSRLKSYVEIRSIDCLPVPLAMSVPAFIKGLFYNKAAFSKTQSLLGGVKADEILDLKIVAAKKGLKGRLGGSSYLKIAEKLVGYAKQGLSASERLYLEPLEEQIFEKKCTPAEDLIRDFKKKGACGLQALSL